MAKLNVMLCCGAGLSSGFLAQRVRAEAKKQKLDLQIEARSESQVAQYLDATDILLLGPHFSSQLPIIRIWQRSITLRWTLFPRRSTARWTLSEC